MLKMMKMKVKKMSNEKFTLKNDTGLEKLIEVLQSHDIKMNIFACSCCENPEIDLWYKGEHIVTQQNVCLEMVSDEKENA